MQKMVYVSLPIAEDATHILHFVSKIPIEKAIKTSGMDYTILRPNNFFQNDPWIHPASTPRAPCGRPRRRAQ